jgi:hypothetical protein
MTAPQAHELGHPAEAQDEVVPPAVREAVQVLVEGQAHLSLKGGEGIQVGVQRFGMGFHVVGSFR